mmetsp:Transcript_89274/g.237289  ORF Transcript_89274/g.237289 Transcript_89274/m.237289 type:complete len:238 (+) Transcript_89274:223-936(+)
MMVAATLAEDSASPAGATAEDGVDPASHHLVQRTPQRLLSHRRALRVEVPHQDHSIPGLRDHACDAQQRVGRRLRPAPAARVDGQGAMVVQEEDRPGASEMSQADPADGARAVVLVMPVLRDQLAPSRKLLPRALVVGHCQAVPLVEDPVGVAIARIVQDPLRSTALLEGHDVVWPVLRYELAGAAPVAASHAKEVPPEQVVRQHLDRKRVAARPEHVPPRHGNLRLAPLPRTGSLA